MFQPVGGSAVQTPGQVAEGQGGEGNEGGGGGDDGYVVMFICVVRVVSVFEW